MYRVKMCNNLKMLIRSVGVTNMGWEWGMFYVGVKGECEEYKEAAAGNISKISIGQKEHINSRYNGTMIQ